MKEDSRAKRLRAFEGDSPPILGSWRKIYFAVLSHLAFWILIFYLFTLRFDLSG